MIEKYAYKKFDEMRFSVLQYWAEKNKIRIKLRKIGYIWGKEDTVMTLEEIRKQLEKNAIIFQTGGIQPTYDIMESWFGRVGWKKAGEEVPKDPNGKRWHPLQHFL